LILPSVEKLAYPQVSLWYSILSKAILLNGSVKKPVESLLRLEAGSKLGWGLKEMFWFG
jgi:hypothetical protein